MGTANQHALKNGTRNNTSAITKAFLTDAQTEQGSIDEILPNALRAIRTHLGMEVAFISEFVDGRRQFCYVDAASANPPVKVGDSDPLEESYCQRVVDRRLPELIHDASQIPAARALPVTMALPVGAHLSIPIHLSDGRVYGTFCCFSTVPDQSLAERDLALMRVFAEFAAAQIERRLAADRTRQEAVDRIRSVLNLKNLHIVYQPIYHLETNRIVGLEALTRFPAAPERTPDVWFSEAAQVGWGPQLETAVIQQALLVLDRLPKDVYLSLNTSPETILSGAITDALDGAALNRIVLEVTEHVAIPDYAAFAAALAPLRKLGLSVAVDDAGAGYASFRHILQLNADIIKLDISLTRNIDTDRARRALASALIRFAEETGSTMVAEGVETRAELDTLRGLRVSNAQGYLLGRPMLIADVATLPGVQGWRKN